MKCEISKKSGRVDRRAGGLIQPKSDMQRRTCRKIFFTLQSEISTYTVKLIIGIDDTDNLETRGTGHHARMLGHALTEAGLFELKSVTRHQLLADRRIPFTSHNSSASLTGTCTGNLGDLIRFAKEFLIRESAFDSDAGLCVATEEEVTEAMVAFGNRAKHEIVTMEEALNLVKGTAIYLDAFLNTRIGLIGSLAAAGLRKGGNDGRLLWTRNLRETTGTYTIRELLEIVGIDQVVGKDMTEINPGSTICIGEWCRPVMVERKITLIAEKTENNEPYVYRSASKEYIKSISE
jgi:hypothetical protein